MPKQRYSEIYNVLKERIEKEAYPHRGLLPSENELKNEFSCSRNTIRRAISVLIEDGYVQAIQGKGVVCIYRPSEAVSFFSNEIETFREACLRNGLNYKTKVIRFEEITADEELHQQTGFDVCDELYYITRIHIINDEPLILNHNYFLKSISNGLTAEIAENSVYDYLENVLGVNIVSSKRLITVDKVTPDDRKYLKVNSRDFNCMAVMTNHTYDSNGVMFEHTESRHLPKYFSFSSTATRSH